MGFGQGLSGLNAAAQELDVIGNNIANANTVGFKASTVAFSDIYATSKVGLGAKVSSVNQRFTSGTITNTGNQLDLAVDGNNGMFRVEDKLGNVMYTRNGQFFQDSENYIVNAQGQRLTGFGLVGTDISPIRVPVGNLEPIASKTIATQANLNAKAPVIYLTEVTEGFVYARSGTDPFERMRFRSEVTDPTTSPATVVTTLTMSDGTAATGAYDIADNSSGTGAFSVSDVANPTAAELSSFLALDSITKNLPKPFSPTDPDSYTHSLPITTYDSLGNPHQLNQYFVKREGSATDSNWDVYYTFDGEIVQAVAADPTATPPVVASDSHKLTFSQSGTLTGGDTLQLSISNVGGLASPAADLNLSLSYGGSTSFSGDFAYNFSSDGFPTGEYSNIEIGQDGAIVAIYTNGERRPKGYIALADFNNLNGLRPVGDNAWVETGASGQPILGRPGTNGLALIRGQAVEESNVDMSAELVRMIISQRFYQANAQTIKTQDQILQTLITMR